LIKCIKNVLWRAAKRLSYIEDARCLKVNMYCTSNNRSQRTDACGTTNNTSSVVEKIVSIIIIIIIM
jgi:hypothetical protein